MKAIQFTGDNYEEIKKEMGLTVHERLKTTGYIEALIETPKDDYLIFENEYILKRGDEVMICPQDIYEFIFRKP